MDYQLSRLMKEQKKPVKALETFQESYHQIESSYQGNPQENILQATQYHLSIGGMLNDSNLFLDTVDYIRGEYSMAETSPLNDSSIIKRNNAWMPKLLGYFQQYPKGSLVTVGLLHLVGKHGLLNQFFKQRFRIERANSKGQWFDILNPKLAR